MKVKLHGGPADGQVHESEYTGRWIQSGAWDGEYEIRGHEDDHLLHAYWTTLEKEEGPRVPTPSEGTDDGAQGVSTPPSEPPSSSSSAAHGEEVGGDGLDAGTSSYPDEARTASSSSAALEEGESFGRTPEVEPLAIREDAGRSPSSSVEALSGEGGIEDDPLLDGSSVPKGSRSPLGSPPAESACNCGGGPHRNWESGDLTYGHALDCPARSAPPSSSADPYDNLVRCTNCKELQRAGYRCSNCGKLVPKPVDKYPGQTDHIPFRPTA